MELNEFISAFAEQFDDTDASVFSAVTNYHDIDEWSSLMAMSVIAMVKTDMDVTISGKDIKDCETIEQLFNLIISKK